MSDPDSVILLDNDVVRSDSPTVLASRAPETVPTVTRFGTATLLPHSSGDHSGESPSARDACVGPDECITERITRAHHSDSEPADEGFLEQNDGERTGPRADADEFDPVDMSSPREQCPERECEQCDHCSDDVLQTGLSPHPRAFDEACDEEERVQPRRDLEDDDSKQRRDEAPEPEPAFEQRPEADSSSEQKPTSARRSPPNRAQADSRPAADARPSPARGPQPQLPRQRLVAARTQPRVTAEPRAQPRRTTTLAAPAGQNARPRREPQSRTDVTRYSNANEAISALENRVYELTTENDRLTADLRGMRRVQEAQEKQLMALTDRLAEPEREADSLRNELRAVREQLRREHASYLELEKQTRVARRENQILRRRVATGQVAPADAEAQEPGDEIDSLAMANIQMDKPAPPLGSDPSALQDAARRVLAAAGESPESLLEIAEVRRRLGSYSLDLAAADASMREARRIITTLAKELRRDTRPFIARVTRAGEDARNAAQQQVQVHFAVAGAAAEIQGRQKPQRPQPQTSPSVKDTHGAEQEAA